MPRESTEAFEKLYQRALAAARLPAGFPILEWKPYRGSPSDTVVTHGPKYSARAWRGGFAIIHNWSGHIVEQDELTDSSILRAQRAAEEALRKHEAAKIAPAKVESALTKLNAALTKLTTNRYTKGVPLNDLIDATKSAGFYVSEDSAPIISTHNGRDTVPIGYPGSNRDMALAFTWHRMDSGNYETVAYAN